MYKKLGDDSHFSDKNIFIYFGINQTMKNPDSILSKNTLDKDDIIALLELDEKDSLKLFAKATEVKSKSVGKITYFRGLIEFSNHCSKNCLYCGIRAGNEHTHRYELDDESILYAAKFAYDRNYASIVLQSGEISSTRFIDRIDNLIKKIKELSDNKFGITLSVGEQSYETYKRWFDSGGHRYLLRVESSTPELYNRIHPQNAHHSFDVRMEALQNLKKIGYQTGTGVMIGLPWQTTEHLANDLLFFREFDVDMVGMGPFIEHSETPLYEYRNTLLPLKQRLHLAFKMIAILRIIMPDINIAAATALQAIDPMGREKAIRYGANVIMPNITPTTNRKNYQLYENKPCIDEGADDCVSCLEKRIEMAGDSIGYGKWGDSRHFYERMKNAGIFTSEAE